MRRYGIRAGAAALVLLLTGACSVVEGIGGGDEPPESMYTQAEAYAAMEAEAAATVALLPDFPGFESRAWRDSVCTHDGVEDPDYVSVEVEYVFSEDDARLPLLREDYVEILRKHWATGEYEVTLDDVTPGSDRTDISLLASVEERELSVAYRVGYLVGLRINSGCMPASEIGEFEYIPPLAGVEPGSKHDLVGDFFPEGIPAAEEQQ